MLFTNQASSVTTKIAIFIVILFATVGAAIANHYTPTLGTPISLKVGESQTFTISGNGTCSYNVSGSANVAGIVSLDKLFSTTAKTHKFKVTGVAVGVTNVTFTPDGQSPCNLQGVFQVTVEPNVSGMIKSFDSALKARLGTYNSNTKDSIINLKTDLALILSNGNLTTSQIADAIDVAIQEYYDDLWFGARDILIDGALDGTNLLIGNNVLTGEAPVGFYPGGCGSWDKFVTSVHTSYDKACVAGKKEITKTEKGLEKLYDLALDIAILTHVFPVVQGPLSSDQQNQANPPKPLEITDAVATDSTGNNGQINVSGVADNAISNTVELELIGPGHPAGSTVVTATVTNGSWTHAFTGLAPGSYVVNARYPGQGTASSAAVFVMKK